MATTEFEDPPAPTAREQVLETFGHTVHKVTDTDSMLPLRTWLLVIVIGVCVLFAPAPANIIGIVAVLALAMTAPARLRSR